MTPEVLPSIPAQLEDSGFKICKLSIILDTSEPATFDSVTGFVA